MIRRAGHIVVMLILLLSSMQIAIAQQRNAFVIAEDHLVVRADLQSSQSELDSLFKLAGVQVDDFNKFLKGDYSAFTNDGWAVAARESNLVEFDKPLTDVNNNPQDKPYKITTRIPSIDGRPGYPAEVPYGVNKFSKVTVYNLASGLTRFILPGASRARHVFLSGSFNSWSTLRGLMTKADGGWVLDVKLDAGPHEYKYIIDGRWIDDPNNLSKTDDGGGHRNSVYYKYNHTFKLSGYAPANKVTVVGDFNNWDVNDITMQKTAAGWERELYLSEGLHQYGFVVDGRRIPDPENPDNEKDKGGNFNSNLNVGTPVIFVLPDHAEAKKVILKGDFADGESEKFVLKRHSYGWKLTIKLPKGNYKYNYDVDGNRITDPQNAHQIVENDSVSSVVSVRPNHTFKLKGFNKAKKIVLAGTFNNWNPDGYTLEHKGDEWTIDLYLKPGKHLYKFIVDGNWMIDPGNKYYENNRENTGNSVLWME